MKLIRTFCVLMPLWLGACPAAGLDRDTRDPLTPPPGSGGQRDPGGTPDFEGLGPNSPAPFVRHQSDRDHGSATMPHSFEDAARWSARFDAPERDAWQLPDLVVSTTLGPAPKDGLTLVDLGAGTGYFTLRFAKALPAGKVVAADIESSLLHWTARRATEEGLTNVSIHQSTGSGPAWPDAKPKADIVFLCNVYHHIEGREGWFAAVRDMTTPDAKLVVIDFTPASKRGPPAAHKLAPDKVVSELIEAGWQLDTSHDLLPDQYFLVFRKAP